MALATKKIRVYELARELGVENAVVLDLANELKIGVKSHSSSIDDPSADRVRRLADSKGLRKEPVVEEPEPEPAPPPPPPEPEKVPAAEKAPAPVAEPAEPEVAPPPPHRVVRSTGGVPAAAPPPPPPALPPPGGLRAPPPPPPRPAPTREPTPAPGERREEAPAAASDAAAPP